MENTREYRRMTSKYSSSRVLHATAQAAIRTKSENTVTTEDLVREIVSMVLRKFPSSLSLVGTQNGSQYYGTCPLPGHAGDGDNPNAFSLNTEKNAWRCLTHCGSGNVIDLYAQLSNLNPKDKGVFRDCALEMQQRFLGGVETRPQRNTSKEKKALAMRKLIWRSRPW